MPSDIVYRSTVRGLTPSRLRGFFEGWPDPPSAATHLRILRDSHAVELAVERSTGRVVGFVNAVSDGVLCAYLPLLEVLPSHRGRGIGSELVRRLLRRLDDLYMVDLGCDPDLRPFYERLGFTASLLMARRNYARQSGGRRRRRAATRPAARRTRPR